MRTSSTRLLSFVLMFLGIAITARTAAAGASGLAVGYLIGPVLVILGIARLWLDARLRGGER